MKKLRWGILSTAHIARTKVIPALQASSRNEVIAIASRNEDTAKKVADELHLPTAYGSYEALINDPTIDAIYNPLPNHLHVPWSIAAIKAGKHVLCEKPLGLHQQDVEKLITIAKQHPSIHVMEAFMYRFHEQWQKAQQLIQQDAIGQVRHIHSHFSYNNRDEENIRNYIEMGGGALMDIGCYCISLARFLYNEEPLRVLGQITPYAGYEVDCFVSGMMEFADGNASFTASTKIEAQQYVEAHGEKGSIFIPLPFNPPSNATTEMYLTRNGNKETIVLPPCDHYQLMGDAFAASIAEKSSVPTPLADALANMRILDAIVKSAESREWISLS